MAQVQKLPPPITPEEYLEGEKIAEFRSEFVDGVVYAMSGVSEAHNDIAFNLTMWLGNRLPDGCRLFSGSVKLGFKTGKKQRYYYPDAFVSCGPRNPKEYVRRDATLVVEILSPSTERVDRGEKFEAYTSIASVQEYLIVAQDGARVEVFRRRTAWTPETYESGDAIELGSIGQKLPIAEVYKDITF